MGPFPRENDRGPGFLREAAFRVALFDAEKSLVRSMEGAPPTLSALRSKGDCRKHRIIPVVWAWLDEEDSEPFLLEPTRGLFIMNSACI